MMFNRISLVAVALVGAVSVVKGQTIPDVTAFPAACATDCASTIELATLCISDYSNNTDIAACFCVGLPSNSSISTCSTCLTSVGSSDIGSALKTAAAACPAALETCAFECDFSTCKSSDIACQCSKSYLQNILQCASCNTAHNNTGTTMVSDYKDLEASCLAQNYTATPDGTTSLPSPTGQGTYVAPTLTNTASRSGAAASSARSGTVSVAASTTASVTTARTTGTNTASVSAAAAAVTSSAASAGFRNGEVDVSVLMWMTGVLLGAIGLAVLA